MDAVVEDVDNIEDALGALWVFIVEHDDTGGQNAVYNAHATRLVERVHALGGVGALSQARDATGYTLLHAACDDALVTLVTLLLRHGCAPDVHMSADDTTPLMHAISSGARHAHTCIRLLIAAGADVNARAAHGISVLSYALASRLDFNALVTLLDAGANVHTMAAGVPLLHFMARFPPNDAFEVSLREVIRRGADVHAISQHDGATPLHAAARARQHADEEYNPCFARVLIEAGAHAGAHDAAGRTPADVLRENEGLFEAGGAMCASGRALWHVLTGVEV